MVTLLEWQLANDYTVFENKDNKKRIIKVLLKENLRAIETKMIQDYAKQGELPTKENVTRIQDLIASILENFEVVDITKKETEKGVPVDEKAAGHIPSQNKKGEFCYKCGLQKEDTKVVAKGDGFIRMCKECLGV